MEYIEKIKKMLCKELDEYAMKSKITMQDLEPLQLMTDIVKNLDKIEMLEGNDGYSETYPYYMGGSSYAGRGRGRNARRDSMGRYSSDMGSSYDDYSEERMDRRYSRDDAKDHMMNKLGEMMSSADEEQREILKDAMRKIERA
jgi:hypothetical protein